MVTQVNLSGSDSVGCDRAGGPRRAVPVSHPDAASGATRMLPGARPPDIVDGDPLLTGWRSLLKGAPNAVGETAEDAS